MLRSFDLSAATDRFPLEFQRIAVEKLFNSTVAQAWVVSGLGCNLFHVPSSGTKHAHGPELFVRFLVGQPLGLLSSWPLFALCHHLLIWYSAFEVYGSSRRFSDYAVLGDDVVIGDAAVAERYRCNIEILGVKVSIRR